jgi:hypothetical protein
MSWAQILEKIDALAKSLFEEWNVRIPFNGEIPDDALDAECDRWCVAILQGRLASVSTPVQCRPWILARCLCAYSAAKQFASESTQPDTALPATIIQTLLTTMWHEQGKLRWKDFPRQAAELN